MTDDKKSDANNYVFFDEKAGKWRCVYEGKVMAVLHESEQKAKENLGQLFKLDGDYFSQSGGVITG